MSSKRTGQLDRRPRSWTWLRRRPTDERTRRFLTELLGLGYFVLDDVETGAGHLSHVVLGPTGVYAIVAKGWKGRIYPKPGGIRSDRRDRGKALKGAAGQADEIRRRLGGAGVPARVQPVLLLPRAVFPHGALRAGSVAVLGPADLVTFVLAGTDLLTEDDQVRARAAVLRGDATVTVRKVSLDET
jgi:hypothetical protein